MAPVRVRSPQGHEYPFFPLGSLISGQLATVHGGFVPVTFWQEGVVFTDNPPPNANPHGYAPRTPQAQEEQAQRAKKSKNLHGMTARAQPTPPKQHKIRDVHGMCTGCTGSEWKA